MAEKVVLEQPDNLMEFMEIGNFETVVFCQDADTGLKAIIAIHDTTLGPAGGGCRMWTYPSYENAGLSMPCVWRGE